MKRVPLVATAIVAMAVVTMVALGVWQLQRRSEKAALLTRLTANAVLPATALPERPSAEMRFRTVVATCAAVEGWRQTAGRTTDGETGYRHIATCREPTGARFAVDVGVGNDPQSRPTWSGGMVRGALARVPGDGTWLDRMTAHGDADLAMLVADLPAPGLARSQPPSVATVPNNHLAYALQWFFFAGAALVIYALALRRRSR